MSLFTDSDIITPQDLAALDPEFFAVVKSLNPHVVVDGDGSIIRNAVDECGQQIRMKFQNFSGYLVSPGININHVAAVLNILSTAINRPRMRLNQVVAFDPDPTKRLLKRWLAYYALYSFYRGAYARVTTQDDRYGRRMEIYQDEAKKAWNRLIADGMPVVLQPLPCPGALREFGAGTFGASNVTNVAGSSSDPGGRQYYVSITWVAQPAYVSPANKGNAESGGSAVQVVAPAASELIRVSIAGLTPPGSVLPAVGTADGLYTQLTASGWNVYVGTDQTNFYLQNATPISIGTTTYTLADAPVLSGNLLTPGQFADYSFAFQNMLMRA